MVGVAFFCWLPALSGAEDGDPWAVDAGHVASKRLEVALGSYVGASQELGGEFYWLVMVSHLLMLLMSGLLGVWSWMVFLAVGVAGCGVYGHASGAAWFGRQWGHLDLLLPLPDGAGEACRLYCSIPGPLQTVQRAEIWGVLAALQG